jgi:hypothetical protein
MPTLSQLGIIVGALSFSACSAPPRAKAPPLRAAIRTEPREPDLPPELPRLDLEFRSPPPAAPAREPTPPSGEELARELAARLLEGASPEDGGLPPPRSEADNNPFAIVRSARELAEEEEGFVLAPDRASFAFIRPEYGSYHELWIADVDGSNARLLVDLRTSIGKLAEGETGLVPSDHLFAPTFSADGLYVYFQTDGWATSLALYSVSVEHRRFRFVSDANGFMVIRQCTKKALVGSLIAYRHSYSELPMSAVDWYFLLDPSGKRLGVVGDDPENVDRFLEKTCGFGRAPARLKQLPGCEGEVLRYEPKRFLDGSVLELFYWVSSANARRPLRGNWSDGEWLGAPMGPAEAEASLSERCEK